MTTINAHCPTCQQNDTWNPTNSFRPFCSERCKLIDLGQWADETNRIPLDHESNSDE